MLPSPSAETFHYPTSPQLGGFGLRRNLTRYLDAVHNVRRLNTEYKALLQLERLAEFDLVADELQECVPLV